MDAQIGIVGRTRTEIASRWDMKMETMIHGFIPALLLAGWVMTSNCVGAESGGVPWQNVVLAAAPRTVADFDSGWLFSKSDPASAAGHGFDDSTWRRVDVPHDWSIGEKFDPSLASCTGFLPGGIAWYRKHFSMADAARGKRVHLEFDGIYQNSRVWLNGFYIGGRPYGYSSFEVDLTPYLKFGGQDNIVAVRVDHSRFADSRWYTGSGIYRHTRLRITDARRIAPWGVFVTSPEVTADRASVRVETTVLNGTTEAADWSLTTEILDPDGKIAGTVATDQQASAGAELRTVQLAEVSKPRFWSPDEPWLYTARSRLRIGSALIDETVTTFGIRTLRFDPDKGMFLNGKPIKIKGVCVHHDAGCLGAAVPDGVLERRLRILKEIGANAIRTSHNPPAPELLECCDRIGLMVKDEAFDEFYPSKNKWIAGWNSGTPARSGYAEDFAEWSVRDAADMVRRDRNHPSVIMWSIGNEIDYANDPFSHPVLGGDYRPDHPRAEEMVKLARPLIAAVKAADPTRPVTMALANAPMSDAVGLGKLLDVVGYNYQEVRYDADHARFPKRFLFGSETSHRYADWLAARDKDFVGGQFLWTGVDYLGEAGRFPTHGSRAGLLDLCGFKKPLAWFRQSLWSDRPMVYLAVSRGGGGGSGRGWRMPRESWNWPEGNRLTVQAYSNCPEVRLTLNGRDLGTRSARDAAEGTRVWEVPFEAGTLKATGLGGGGKPCEFTLETAGPAARVGLHADPADPAGNIRHIEFRVADARGVRVPDGANLVKFAIAGPAVLLGLENGDLNTPDTYQTESRKVLQGRGLAIVKLTGQPGEVTLTATAEGLESASLTIPAAK